MIGHLLACCLFTFLWTVSSQSVSITDGSAFSSLRSCAQGCIGSTSSGPLFLASGQLSCPSPYDNSCFCLVDLQQKADSYLRSCINKACTNTLDASSAVSVYDDYCTSAGFVEAAATTGTQSSFTTSVITSIGSSTKTNSASSGTSSTSSTSNSSNTIGGLSKGEFWGIIVSAVGSLAGVIGVWIMIKKRRG